MKLGFTLCFLVIILHLADLQVFSQSRQVARSGGENKINLITSKRGQIFIQDFGKGKSEIPVTSTQILANVWFDPLELKKGLDKGLEIEDVAGVLAGSLNMNYEKILDILKIHTGKKSPTRFEYLQKFINSQQKSAIQFLIDPREIHVDKNDRQYNFYSWLQVDEVNSRSYPEGKLMASTIGYISQDVVPKEEAKNTECRQMVEENERRGTDTGRYVVGYYGLEQKYCSVLGGLNGRTILNTERGTSDEMQVQNGSNIHLTIDRTMQQKCEEILFKAIEENTNANGKPRDGSITVMNPQTGRILAMCSYPVFDPNKPGEAESIESFRNVASSLDYEVGSSMKPLTVAAALNEYQTGNLSSKGERLGVPPDWKKVDYDKKGKIYTEKDPNGNVTEEIPITNSQKFSYQDQGPRDLRVVIRDSLNTLTSDIADTMGNRKLREYFEQKFMFGKPTEAAFAGGGSGNIQPFEDEIMCQVCYARFGFGQGFYIAPLQLMRAYTAIANEGKIVEPYLIEKIVDAEGNVDDGTATNSIIKRPRPQPVITAQSARLVTSYMQAVLDEGYLGQKPQMIKGYTVAAKTGTAQVTRPIIVKDENGNDKQIVCNYDCNTARGIYDHSLIGFGPTKNPQIMVMVKISEPHPGAVTNFADATSMKPFQEMTKFSLEYMGVPHDRE